MSGDNIVMSGRASLDARNVYGGGGASAVATGNFTMRDDTRMVVEHGWGADSGFIGCSNFVAQDRAVLECADSYADNCGACVLANIVIADNASVRATQMRSKELGAALCGGYPGQNISVEGHASVVVRDSRAGLYGGAMLAHRVSMAGGAFRVELENVTAPCGGAILTLGPGNQVGGGEVLVDGSLGGTLRVIDAVEGNASLGCLDIEANLVDRSGRRVEQPCGRGCGGGGVAAECQCDPHMHQNPAAVLECCTPRQQTARQL